MDILIGYEVGTTFGFEKLVIQDWFDNSVFACTD